MAGPAYSKADQCPPREEKKRRGVNPMSKKRQRDLIRRAEVLEEVERRDGYDCQGRVRGLPGRCGTVGERTDLEGHEIIPRGRDPKSWLNPELVVLLCPMHHTYCTSASGERLDIVRAAGLDVIAAPLPALPNFKETP